MLPDSPTLTALLAKSGSSRLATASEALAELCQIAPALASEVIRLRETTAALESRLAATWPKGDE